MINSLVEGEGAFYRKFSRIRMHLAVFGRRTMLQKLSKYQLFQGVPEAELLQLDNKMLQCKYEVGL